MRVIIVLKCYQSVLAFSKVIQDAVSNIKQGVTKHLINKKKQSKMENKEMEVNFYLIKMKRPRHIHYQIFSLKGSLIDRNKIRYTDTTNNRHYICKEQHEDAWRATINHNLNLYGKVEKKK